MAVKIEPMPDGTYTVRVWAKCLDIYGKRKTKSKSKIKTVTAAKTWGKLAEAEITEQAMFELEPQEQKITFSRLNELYLEARKSKMSPTTYAYLIDTVVPRVNKEIGNVIITNINTRIVQKFVDKLALQENSHKPGQRLRAETIRRYYRHIQAVINWAVGQDLLEYNRIKRVDLPTDEEPFEATTINAQDAGEVLSWLKVNYYNLYIPVLLSVTTSSRRGEFLGLTWDKINFENDTINYSNNRVSVRNDVIDKAKMKTYTSKRILVMSDFLKNELLEHKKLCQALDSPYVCANIFTGEVPTNPRYVTKTFHKVMKKIFNVNMRVQDLRHSFNQMAYEENVDEVTRIKIMGHSQVKTNRNIYTHASLKKNKEAMNLVASEIELAFNNKKS